MSLSNPKRNKNGQDHYLFKGKKSKPLKNEFRSFIEALIMLAIGSNLLIFLYSLPGEFILNKFLEETWTDFSQGFIQLIDSISKICGALIVLLLIVLALILVIGSLVRLSKLFFRYRVKKKRIRKKL